MRNPGYSLIRHRDQFVIQELFFRLQTQEADFVTLAQDYSQGAERQTCGFVGPCELGTLHARLAKLLRVAKLHQVNAPFKIEDWFVIVKLEAWLPAQYSAAMEQRLLDELFQQWLAEQMAEQITLLKDNP